MVRQSEYQTSLDQETSGTFRICPVVGVGAGRVRRRRGRERCRIFPSVVEGAEEVLTCPFRRAKT